MLPSDWEPQRTICVPYGLMPLHETSSVCISDVEHSLGLRSAMLGKALFSHSPPPPRPPLQSTGCGSTADGIS